MGFVPSLWWVNAPNVMAELEPNGAEPALAPTVLPRNRCTLPPRMGVDSGTQGVHE